MKNKSKGRRETLSPPNYLVHELGRCPSVFRTVQSEGLNHPTDNPVFGRRIGTQSLAKTAKEGQESPGNDTDHRKVFGSQPPQALALDRYVMAPDPVRLVSFRQS